MRTKKIKGFSLIELLIVVAIILIIAAIAIPNLMRARRSANEGSAAASMRTLGSGELLYQSSHNDFGTLTALRDESIIDSVLGSGYKSGYTFAVTTTAHSTTTMAQFTATGAPTVATGVSQTGNRYYFTDQTNVIRFAIGAAANGSSAPLD